MNGDLDATVYANGYPETRVQTHVTALFRVIRTRVIITAV